MKKTNRIQVLLLSLTYMHVADAVVMRDLIEITGYSRTAMFRLLQFARDDFFVSIQFDQGSGYSIQDWGVFQPEAVMAQYRSAVQRWIDHRLAPHTLKKNSQRTFDF